MPCILAVESPGQPSGEFQLGLFQVGCAQTLGRRPSLDDGPLVQPWLFCAGVSPDPIGDADPGWIRGGLATGSGCGGKTAAWRFA